MIDMQLWLQKEKTYSLFQYTEDGKWFLDVTYAPDAMTQKFIRFDKPEHVNQFVDVLGEAGYKEHNKTTQEEK